METLNNQDRANQLFHEHQHLAETTLYKTLGQPHNIARSKGIDFEDLLQVAYIGLWNACLDYDETKSNFQTYAINHINWSVKPALNNDFNYFKYPSNKTPKEEYHLESFDAAIHDLEDTRTLHDKVADNESDSIESEAVLNLAIEEYSKYLSERQQEIVKLKAKGWMEVDIARHIGISKQAVDQNMKSIRKKISREGVGDFRGVAI